MASRAPATSASASCAKTPVSGSTMPIFTDGSSRARIGNGATTALAAHAMPALRTARRPIRRACGDAAFRVCGYKLAAPNQPGQTLVALADVGKVRVFGCLGPRTAPVVIVRSRQRTARAAVLGRETRSPDWSG